MEPSPADIFRAWANERVRLRRLTHAQVAMRSGLDRSTVSRILNGDRDPALETALRLMKVLDGEDTPTMYARLARVADPMSGVERALADDPLLSAAQRTELLDRYRSMRKES